MLGRRAVHGVVEDDIVFAGGEADLHQLLEQGAGVDAAAHRLVLRAAQREFLAVAHRLHEFVGQEDAMVQVQRLAVERSEEHTSELQSLMRISYAVFCLKKKKKIHTETTKEHRTITSMKNINKN